MLKKIISKIRNLAALQKQSLVDDYVPDKKTFSFSRYFHGSKMIILQKIRIFSFRFIDNQADDKAFDISEKGKEDRRSLYITEIVFL